MFETANISKFAPEDKTKYDYDMTTERDIRNQIRYAEKKGREEQKLENARDLKRLGVAIDTIAQALGLSVDEIQAL